MNKISKLFLMLIAFVGLGITQSCNQNDDVIETSNQSKVDAQFLKLGISKRTYNEKVNLTEIKGLSNNSFAKSSNLSEADEVFYYTDGSKAYIFNTENGGTDENYVIKVNSNNDLLTTNNVTITNFVDNLNYTTTFTDENNILVSVNIVNGIPQDGNSVNVLGKRKPGESFGACFKRTYIAFMDEDFIGFIAGTFAPREVAVAVAITCI
jgi:hypothetical protein